MMPLVKRLLDSGQQPKIPLELQPYVVADWDVAENGNARYNLNQLLTNGNFATGTAELATGWTKYFPDRGTWSFVTGEQTVTNATNVNSGLRQDINVIAGQTIYAHFRLKGTNGKNARVSIEWRDAGAISSVSSNYAMTNDYQVFTVYGVAPLNTTNARIVCYITQDIGDSMTVNQSVTFNCTTDFGLSNCPSTTEMSTIIANSGRVIPLRQRAKGGNFPSVADFETNFPTRTNITYSTANNRLTFAADATNGEHRPIQPIGTHGVTPVAGRTYILRCYVHSVSVGQFRLELTNRKSDSTAETSTSLFTAGQNGWATCLLTLTSVNATPSLSLQFRVRDAAGNNSFAGSGESATISDFSFFSLSEDFESNTVPTLSQFTEILKDCPDWWEWNTDFNKPVFGFGGTYHEGVQSYVCNPNKQAFLTNAKQPYATEHLKMNNFAYTTASGIVRSPVPHVRFDGTDDWMGLAKPDLIPANSSFSVSVWYFQSLTSGTFLTYGFADSFTDNPSLIIFYDAANTRFIARVYHAAGSQEARMVVNNLVANKWYHITLSFNISNKFVNGYVNGQLLNISGFSLAGNNLSVNYYRIGRNSAGTTYSNIGIAQNTIFNKALTKDDVRNLFNARASEFGYAKI